MHAWSRLIATGAVATGPRTIIRITLTAAADAATAIVYDAAGGATDPVTKLAAPIGTTVSQELSVNLVNGIYVALTGTNPVCCVVYR